MIDPLDEPGVQQYRPWKSGTLSTKHGVIPRAEEPARDANEIPFDPICHPQWSKEGKGAQVRGKGQTDVDALIREHGGRPGPSDVLLPSDFGKTAGGKFSKSIVPSYIDMSVRSRSFVPSPAKYDVTAYDTAEIRSTLPQFDKALRPTSPSYRPRGVQRYTCPRKHYSKRNRGRAVWGKFSEGDQTHLERIMLQSSRLPGPGSYEVKNFERLLGDNFSSAGAK